MGRPQFPYAYCGACEVIWSRGTPPVRRWCFVCGTAGVKITLAERAALMSCRKVDVEVLRLKMLYQQASARYSHWGTP